MTSKSRFKSDAFEAIRSAGRGLQRAGTIDKATMRDFDESCLTAPVAITPQAIKRIREGAHVSQPVFARYLNTSESTVQKWEAGTKRPSGMASSLESVMDRSTQVAGKILGQSSICTVCEPGRLSLALSRLRFAVSGMHRALRRIK